MIRVQCPKPNCHNHTEVPEMYIGRPVRCKKCGTSFTIQKPVSVAKPAPRPVAATPLAPVLPEAAASGAARAVPVLEAPPLLAEPEVAEIEIIEDDFVVPAWNAEDIPIMPVEEGIEADALFSVGMTDTQAEANEAG